MSQKGIALIARYSNWKLRRPYICHEISRSVKQFSTLATICRHQYTRVNLDISMINRYVLAFRCVLASVRCERFWEGHRERI